MASGRTTEVVKFVAIKNVLKSFNPVRNSGSFVYGSKANLSIKGCSDISRIGRKLEIAQSAKSCSKRKKVARNTRVCQKVAEQLMESPMGDQHNYSFFQLELDSEESWSAIFMYR